MLSCRAGGWNCCCGIAGFSPSSGAAALLFFELPRFQVRLSFRLRELIDEGVAGSSLGPGVGDLGIGLSIFKARGPAGFWCKWSPSTGAVIFGSSPPVLDRFKKECSNPPFGADEERKGEILGFWSISLIPSDESVELASGVGVRRCVPCTVLLLLNEGMSIVSSYRVFEKKALRDAVIGVDGVLGSSRDGGGLESSPTSLESGYQESFPTLGMLSGPRLIGGRLKGCRFFLCDGVAGFPSSTPVGGI